MKELRRAGKATLETPDYVLDGTFQDDRPEGYCTINWRDQCTFRGILEKGRLKKGIYTFASGNNYEGSFDKNG
jgi:hypothetical protein